MGQIVDESQITGTQLSERLLVEPTTGVILGRRDNQKGGQKLIDIGYIKQGSVGDGGGYLMVNFAVGYRKYKKIRGHQIVWAWVHGKWPDEEIDHINVDRADNRIENLRECSIDQNRTNRRMSATRTSGFKWCTQVKSTGKWRVQIEKPKSMTNGKREFYFRRDGFNTGEEAFAIASEVAKNLHGAFFNPGNQEESVS